MAAARQLLLHGLRLVLVDLAAEGIDGNSHGNSPRKGPAQRAGPEIIKNTIILYRKNRRAASAARRRAKIIPKGQRPFGIKVSQVRGSQAAKMIQSVFCGVYAAKYSLRVAKCRRPALAAGQGAERSEIPLVKKSNALFDYLYSCSKNIGLIATTSSYSACSTCTEAFSAFRSALSTSSASGAVCARPSRRMRIIRRRTMGWA